MSSRSLTLCCLHLCKADAELYELLSLATAVLYFSYTSVCLPPFLRSDIKSKSHFTELESGHGSLMDEQLRACRKGA